MDSLYPRPSRARIRWPKLRPVVRHLHLPLGLVCRLLPRRHLVAQRAGSSLHPEGRHVRPPCISQLQTLAEGRFRGYAGDFDIECFHSGNVPGTAWRCEGDREEIEDCPTANDRGCGGPIPLRRPQRLLLHPPDVALGVRVVGGQIPGIHRRRRRSRLRRCGLERMEGGLGLGRPRARVGLSGIGLRDPTSDCHHPQLRRHRLLRRLVRRHECPEWAETLGMSGFTRPDKLLYGLCLVVEGGVFALGLRANGMS